VTTAYLRADLWRDEGVRYKAYRDSRGIWTIGVGHNIQADLGLRARLSYLISDGLTPADVAALLDHDIAAACHALDVALPWWRTLDDIRQDVLANMTFNMGIATLLTFHGTLAALQAHDWVAAALHMSQSLWAGQVGARATRLENQMRTGVHQGADLRADSGGPPSLQGGGGSGNAGAGQSPDPGGPGGAPAGPGVLLGAGGSVGPVASQVAAAAGRVFGWLKGLGR
jgi:lysozyme